MSRRRPTAFFQVTGSRDFLAPDNGDRRYWPIPPDPIADYSRGLRHGVLLGMTAGAALVAFALWIGILQGQL